MSYLCRKFSLMYRPVAALLIFSLFFGACSHNNVTVDDSLTAYFDSAGVKGTFALFDNGHGDFTISDLKRYSDSFYTPGATFDIILSLVAIQTGVVKDEKSSIGQVFDSLQRILTIKEPATLGESFRDTTDAGEVGFEELGTRELARDTLKFWIDSLKYGNKDMGTSAHPVFWDAGPLKINADQQLGLLKKLYFNQLHFFNRTQEIVRGMFTEENNSAFRLTYKTAQAQMNNGGAVGWVMGWIEENKHPYFFVVNLDSPGQGKDLRATGLEIAKKILQRLGFFQGLK
jgi:beta-lactamase class D